MTSSLPSETPAEQAIAAAVVALCSKLERGSKAIYAAVERVAADDISALFLDAANMLRAAYAVRTAPAAEERSPVTFVDENGETWFRFKSDDDPPPAAGEAEPKSERDTATEPASATIADRSRSETSISSAVALAIEALGKARILAANYVDERYRYKATPVLLGITAALAALTAAKGTAASDRFIRKPVADAERGKLIADLDTSVRITRKIAKAEINANNAAEWHDLYEATFAVVRARDLLQSDSDAREDE